VNEMSIEQLLQQMSPEQLAQYSQSATIDPAQDNLNKQLAQAHALRLQAGQRPAYGAGAGLGMGLANILGAVQENKLQGQNQQLNQQRSDQMKALLQLLRGQQGGQAPSSPIAPGGGSPGAGY
jgi:hypothetical protein